jgi:hypothetical protein
LQFLGARQLVRQFAAVSILWSAARCRNTIRNLIERPCQFILGAQLCAGLISG